MEQELYYLIAKFLNAGPCKEAAYALEKELNDHRQLLPHSMSYEGTEVPMSLDRLSNDFPDVNGTYLLDLLGKFLAHFRDTGDPKVLRVSALRHGDQSLLTMLSAFVPHEEYARSNYLTMSKRELSKLSVHRMLIARELGAKIMRTGPSPTFLSTCYKERVTISGHRNPVFCLAFDRTSRRLFTGSDDFLVKVWCVRTGYLIYTIRGHQSVITDIAINQENTLIATASSDGYVRVWTMDGYKPVVSLRSNTATTKPFTTVNFSPSPRPETRYLMATNEDGLVRLWKWDRDTLQFFDADSPITFSCKFRARDRLRCSSFNYTGTKFAVAGDDGFVYVFSTIKMDTEDGHVITDANSSQDRDARARVGRGRRRVASALFPDKSGQVQAQPVIPIGNLEGHMGSVTDLAYSHDGHRILSGCQDGTARIWSYDKEKRKWNSIVLDIKEPSNVCVVTPSSNNPPSSAHETVDRNTGAMEASEATEFGTLIPFYESTANDQSSHVSATQPVSSNINAPVPATQLPSTDPTQTQTAAPDAAAQIDTPKVSMIAWTADDRLCVVATTHGDIRVYYACNGEPAATLKGHEGETYALDSHPHDPNTILSAGYDGNVILWDLHRNKVITCRHHSGRIFLDCKFSKDGMKYAITDEDGNCTLFSIGGLDKDYDKVRSWTRGQHFYTDYMPLRFSPDGSFVDEQTLQPPHTLPCSAIIDWRGVEYPNQRKLGYGRNIPVHPDTLEIEDLRRLACYEMEEEEIKSGRMTVVMPAIDRAHVAKRRREFVRNDDEDETDANVSSVPQFLPPPLQPFLLPDDSNDEDYHDEADEEAYNSEDENSSAEGGSDEFIARDEVSENFEDDEEEGPVTRSRAGQIRRRSTSPDESAPLRGTGMQRRGRSSRAPTRGRGRGRGGSSSVSTRATRATRKRTRETRADRSEDDEEPVRPRRRRRTVRMSYLESDLDDEEEDAEEASESELIDVMDDDENEEEPDDDQQSDYSEPGPSTVAPRRVTTRRTAAEPETTPQVPDRKGKRRLRSDVPDPDDDDFMASIASSSSSSAAVRSSTTRGGKPGKAKSTRIARPANRELRGKLRNLTVAEIKQHEPTEWIKCTTQSLSKYLPQMGDRIAIMTEGHAQYWETSEMTAYFDEKHGVLNSNEPVVFGTVTGISWQVGPPAFCRLKVYLQELVNVRQALLEHAEPIWAPRGRDVTIDYSDEDGCPEFIVLWERFLVSMEIFKTLQVGQKVDVIYDEGRYSGTVSTRCSTGMDWRRAKMPSPWAYYHVIWDDNESSPEDLSPWEIVPSGEDFRQRYDVGPRLSRADTQRAKDIITWLSNSDEFQLYVHQVNYYDYPNYLSQIAYPICLDMVYERLNTGFYRHREAVIDDIELIRKNAQKYNHETSLANKNAARMANFFKSRFLNPRMPLSWSKGGRKRIQIQESDDEYQEEEEVAEESEESAHEKEHVRLDDADEDDFIDDDDEDDEDYY
ncbi:uncharacterized protein BYT42DRAFT_538143 [Radiomyces spectabilis]|uniref:uncharacterized protein n=1 Tax=Radiomyces spectabilis TaxID=64574 RepID=UPI00221FF7EB|nr:uncharacterized protein BYT42DRAFT_538143 [Radiomyces spectabilis]KAI8370578.1 hypothetical protein BYT42DRAFT_538143 [Radiomyces spectabilis]